ncbi:hypothetical protein D3C81_1070510 [compost metagenome]
MLRRDQPRQQGRCQGRPFAGLGERPLERKKPVVLLGQRQCAVQRQDAAIECRLAGVAEPAPGFVEDHLALIVRLLLARLRRKQPPAQCPWFAPQQVAHHAIARLLRTTQALGRVQVTTQATPTVGNVQQQLQLPIRQTVQPCVPALRCPAPAPAQGVAQLLQGRIGKFDNGFARGFRILLVELLALHVPHIQRTGHHHACQCHTGDEPASRNRHCTT